MKRKIFIQIVLLGAVMVIGGCFTDKSGLDVNKIDEIIIETSDMSSILRVEYLEEINFAPTVKIGDVTNPTTNVTYRWQINQAPGSTQLVELGEERELNTVMKNPILASAYKLIFTVRDEVHGIEYTKSWPLFVSSSFREGIVVADTKDGASSDISLIMDNGITTSYSGGISIKYNIWETQTGERNPSLIKSIAYTIHKPTAILTKNVITTIFENKDIKMYDCLDYSVYQTAEMLFPGKSDNFNPQAFYTINNAQWVLVVNNISYVTNSNQGHTSFMIAASGVNYADNAILTVDNASGAGPYAFWFDSNTGKFHAITMTFTTPATSDVYSTQGVFDPTNLPGRRMVASDISVDGYTTASLLKNSTTNNYELYTISTSYYDPNWNLIPSLPKLKVDLPPDLTPILNSAVSIFFTMHDPIMYVATANKIYAIIFGGGVVSYSEKYTAPAGEQISKAKLYVQGRYRLNKAEFDPLYGPIFEDPLTLNTKAVVVATLKGQNEGSMYLIPFGATGTGDLNTTQTRKYSGFGRILDFTFQGQ